MRVIPCISTSGRATLTQRDWRSNEKTAAAIPHLTEEPGRLAFAEPWQAQVFALAVRLSAEGHFTWSEWTATFGDELKASTARGEPDDGSRYYDCWLAALERIVTVKQLLGNDEIVARKEAWADAYRHTPHGQPVVLAGDTGG